MSPDSSAPSCSATCCCRRGAVDARSRRGSGQRLQRECRPDSRWELMRDLVYTRLRTTCIALECTQQVSLSTCVSCRRVCAHIRAPSGLLRCCRLLAVCRTPFDSRSCATLCCRAHRRNSWATTGAYSVAVLCVVAVSGPPDRFPASRWLQICRWCVWPEPATANSLTDALRQLRRTDAASAAPRACSSAAIANAAAAAASGAGSATSPHDRGARSKPVQPGTRASQAQRGTVLRNSAPVYCSHAARHWGTRRGARMPRRQGM